MALTNNEEFIVIFGAVSDELHLRNPPTPAKRLTTKGWQ